MSRFTIYEQGIQSTSAKDWNDVIVTVTLVMLGTGYPDAFQFCPLATEAHNLNGNDEQNFYNIYHTQDNHP